MSDLLPMAVKAAVAGGAGLVGVFLVTLAGRLGLWLLRGMIATVREFRAYRRWRAIRRSGQRTRGRGGTQPGTPGRP